MSSLSLQTHLVSAQPQLSAVSVDPRGFKTALQSMINFLIEHKILATLWLKLPKDDAWWSDIWQYGQQAAGCTIYALGEQTGHPPDNLAASLRAIPIKQDTQLKREYLCVVVADNFTAALLAARHTTNTGDKRTLQLYSSLSGQSVLALSTGIKTIIERSLPDTVETDLSLDSSSTSQQAPNQPGSPSGLSAGSASLIGASSVGASLIGASSVGTEPSIASASSPEHPEQSQSEHEQSIAGAAVLSQWARCFPTDLSTRDYQPLTELYLAWQLQSQENLRSQLATFRSAEKGANNTLSELCPDFLDQAGRELQSPLTTIKTALTLLGSPTLKLAQRQRYLEMISTQCEHQQALINNIIDLLQIHTTNTAVPQALQLANIIPGIVSTYQPIAEERGIMLAYTVPPTLSEVLGTESELKQVVIQLLNNGIQITPKGGRVWVAAAPYDKDFIALTVQDSGSGISKTDTAKLFDAFYRNTEGNTTGTGLGLTLVQQLVKRMGGSVSVDSAPGRGTTFKILLPVHRRTNSTAGKTAPAISAKEHTHPQGNNATQPVAAQSLAAR